MAKKFLRDESHMRTASSRFLCLVILAWIVAGFASFYLLFGRHKLVAIIILGIVACFAVYSEACYNYYEGVIIEFKNKGFVYTYKLNQDFISGNNLVSIFADKVNKVVIKKRKAIIYGDIRKKQPLKKEQSLNKVVIMVNFGVDRNSVIAELRKCVEVV